jgi:hypothetical protein
MGLPRTSASIRRAAAGLAAATATLALGLLAPVTSAAATPASATVTVTPATGIHSGQEVTVTVTGEALGTTMLAVECSPKALQDGEDACENSSDAVFWQAKNGGVAHLRVFSTIRTALGSINCTTGCLVAVVTLSGSNSISIVGAKAVSFSPPGVGNGIGPPAPLPWPSPSGVPEGKIIVPGTNYSPFVVGGLAPSLSANGAVTGPGVTLGPNPVPKKTVTGVGLLQLVLAAPGTSWASSTDTAAVVDVTLSGGPAQQIVLFAGARPFTYAAEFGDLATGVAYPLTVSVDKTLSNTGRATPTVRVIAARLSIVGPSNPAYLPMQYAPIVYGRPDTAQSDTPLLTFASISSLSGGGHALSYTTIWSKEDAGTSFVPWLELGEWGRMTDITETTQLDVSSTGVISNAEFDSCGCAANYPVNRTSPLEEEVPFHGSYDGTHMIVRNASGNDYQDDTGISAFRMEQPPVSGPQPGGVRETVMDADPWTYRVSAMELSRWYRNGTTSPDSPEIGDTRQYAIIDITCTAINTSAVGIAIQLKGSSVWYSSEFSGGYALYNGGHGRTVVKLPEGWESHAITGVRVVAFHAPGAKTVTVAKLGLTVIGLNVNWDTYFVPHPNPVLVVR